MNNVWKWYFSSNEEFYHGDFETREQAIAAGWGMFAGEGKLYIVQACHAEPCTDMFDFDYVMESFEERNQDQWGEDGQPFVDVTFKEKRSLEQDLAYVLRRYLDKNNALRSWMFHEMRCRSVIDMDAAFYFKAHDYATVLVGSFRYALGRQSYVVSSVVNILLERWSHLGPTQDIIVSEINEAINAGRAGSKHYEAQWQRVLELALK